MRWAWTTPDRSPGALAGLSAALCSISAIVLGAAAIAVGRVAARWLARLLTIALGVVATSTSLVILLGQAPLGSDRLLASRPVPFREVLLGAGAREVLRDLLRDAETRGALEWMAADAVDLKTRSILVLRLHPANPGLDGGCRLVSVVELAPRPQGLLRKKQFVRRTAVAPTFIARAQLEALVGDTA